MAMPRSVYDAFGKLTPASFANASHAALAVDFDRAFTGQVYDNETGLMLYPNRYYSTELGRFVSRDPIGYEASDQNVYRYVNNIPLLLLDPNGTMAGAGLANCQGLGDALANLLWPPSPPIGTVVPICASFTSSKTVTCNCGGAQNAVAITVSGNVDISLLSFGVSVTGETGCDLSHCKGSGFETHAGQLTVSGTATYRGGIFWNYWEKNYTTNYSSILIDSDMDDCCCP